MRPLRILFITPLYPTKQQPVGGIFVREHAKAVRHYDDVVVLHCVGQEPNLQQCWRIEREIDESLTEGIPTHRVWYRNSPIPKTSYFVYIWSVLQASRWIINNEFSPDVIRVHVYKAGVPAVMIGRLRRVPVVVTELFTAFQRRTLSREEVLRERFAFSLTERVLPVSHKLKAAIEEYGIRTRFQVTSNFVDTSIFSPRNDQPSQNGPKRLLFVGLLDSSHKKGFPYLLEALTQLQQERNDWRLDIGGDGPACEEYEQMTLELRLTDKVTFLGLKSKLEVAQYMRQSNLFVLPSIFETFSVVNAEALANGTPILTTKCGGPEEFVAKDVGLLVPAGDSEALCSSLEHMLDHVNDYSPPQIAAYAKALFSPDRIGQRLYATYNENLKKVWSVAKDRN